MSIHTHCLLDESGALVKGSRCPLKNDVLLKAYQTMLLARTVDERMITIQRQGLISFAMSAFGEEAAVVGSVAALTTDDWLFPQYREAATMFWRGESIQDYVHQMFGNGKDRTLGRQMPNHFGSKELNIVTVSSPLGTQIPQAAGAAYAFFLEKKKNIALAYFGEGTTSKEDFHAGLNIAAVKKAPCIFFCRNNGYAISTPACQQYACDGVFPKGAAYGIEAIRVDGNDLFAVYEETQRAKKMCIEGKGPVLIEAMTYRIGAHSTSDDPTAYRSTAEVDEMKKLCPIARIKNYLFAHKLWDHKKEEAFLKELKKTIDDAIDVAKKTPPPQLQSIVEDVYAQPTDRLYEQLQDLRSFVGESDA